LTYAELRLGCRPFPGRELAEIMRGHLEGTPDLGRLAAGEQRVLRRALAKEPEQRYASCLAWVRMLEQAAAEEGNGASGSSRAARAAPRTAPVPRAGSAQAPRPRSSATVDAAATSLAAPQGNVKKRRVLCLPEVPGGRIEWALIKLVVLLVLASLGM